jgi:hypothetical protein
MATIKNNDLVKGLSGSIGKQLVFRTLHGKTVVSHMPRKPDKKKETEAQRNTRATFRKATLFARRVLQDPEKKVYYQQRAKALKLPNAYTAAITDYMRKAKVVKTEHRGTITYRIAKPGFALKEVSVELSETTGASPKVVTRQKNNAWFVHYTPGETVAPSLTLIIAGNSLGKAVRFVDAPV